MTDRPRPRLWPEAGTDPFTADALAAAEEDVAFLAALEIADELARIIREDTTV